jgi:hypothetical protein
MLSLFFPFYDFGELQTIQDATLLRSVPCLRAGHSEKVSSQGLAVVGEMYRVSKI